MRILTALTYYRPHISGLTIYTERLARALAQRGHQVTILTSQFDVSTPRYEVMDGIKIVRAPVMMRISKGVVMPTIGFLATRLALENDVIHLHLPQFDAAGIALRGRLLKKPTVLTYHCDLKLPPGIFNRLANHAVIFMNHLAAIFAHRIVTYTQDYADHSPYTLRYSRKVSTILPPVELKPATQEEISLFAREHDVGNRHPTIGMAARFAAEKGVEVLLEALPMVLQVYPDAKVLYAGQYKDVLGEEGYARRLFPIIEKYQDKGQWEFLGVLRPDQIAAYYSNLDVLVVPSLNSTESFGLVQIEAMISGAPVIASDLPGVRQPTAITGMGRTFPVGDSECLAKTLLSIFAEPGALKVDGEEIRLRFTPNNTAAAYEALYSEIQSQLRRKLS